MPKLSYMPPEWFSGHLIPSGTEDVVIFIQSTSATSVWCAHPRRSRRRVRRPYGAARRRHAIRRWQTPSRPTALPPEAWWGRALSFKFQQISRSPRTCRVLALGYPYHPVFGLYFLKLACVVWVDLTFTHKITYIVGGDCEMTSFLGSTLYLAPILSFEPNCKNALNE